MPTYRCHNPKCADDPHGRLGFNFEAPSDSPVLCPKCGAGKTPRTANLIVKLAVIHFDPPSEHAGIGQGFCACNPEKLLPSVKATGVHDAVTCKACRATELFQNSYAAAKAWDEGDYEVEIDLKKQAIIPKAG